MLNPRCDPVREMSPKPLLRVGIAATPLLVKVGREPEKVAPVPSLDLNQVFNDAQDVMAKDHRLPIRSCEIAIDKFGEPHDDPRQMLVQLTISDAQIVSDLFVDKKPHQAYRDAFQ